MMKKKPMKVKEMKATLKNTDKHDKLPNDIKTGKMDNAKPKKKMKKK